MTNSHTQPWFAV